MRGEIKIGTTKGNPFRVLKDADVGRRELSGNGLGSLKKHTTSTYMMQGKIAKQKARPGQKNLLRSQSRPNPRAKHGHRKKRIRKNTPGVKWPGSNFKGGGGGSDPRWQGRGNNCGSSDGGESVEAL